MLVVQRVPVHYLDHPTDRVQYQYRVYPDRVEVSLWRGGWLRSTERYSYAAARRHYRHQLRKGFTKF